MTSSVGWLLKVTQPCTVTVIHPTWSPFLFSLGTTMNKPFSWPNCCFNCTILLIWSLALTCSAGWQHLLPSHAQSTSNPLPAGSPTHVWSHESSLPHALLFRLSVVLNRQHLPAPQFFLPWKSILYNFLIPHFMSSLQQIYNVFQIKYFWMTAFWFNCRLCQLLGQTI